MVFEVIKKQLARRNAIKETLIKYPDTDRKELALRIASFFNCSLRTAREEIKIVEMGLKTE